MKENNNLNIENETQGVEKKIRKKWSKKKKAGVSCLVIVLLAAITALNLIVVAPAAYLANKYDEPIYSYKLKRVVFPKSFIEYPYIILPTYSLTSFRWEYEKNNRLFNVEYAKDSYGETTRNNRKFFDDYQLEDLELWTTEFLQKQVYDEICGIRIKVSDMYSCYQNNVITNDSAKHYLEFYTKNEIRKSLNNKADICLYVKNNNSCSLTVKEINARVRNEFSNEFSVSENDLHLDIICVNDDSYAKRNNTFANYTDTFENKSLIGF